MFRFIKQIFISAMMLFSSLPNVNSLKCLSLKTQECEGSPEIVDINSNNPIFYPFNNKINKCNGNWNNINNPYAEICVPDVIKDLNFKVLNLMWRTNEMKHIKWHETCKCIRRLDTIICNSKQRWIEGKCRCECKELVDNGVCDKGYVWNSSSCECECDKSCNIDEYFDYSSCKWRKKLIDPLVEECTENINEAELVKITLDKSEDRWNSYVVYRSLFWTFFIFFLISIGISIYFVYRNYVNRNKYDLPY